MKLSSNLVPDGAKTTVTLLIYRSPVFAMTKTYNSILEIRFQHRQS